MKNSIKIILLVLLAWSCSELKRFKTAEIVDAPAGHSYVSVSLFSTGVENGEAKKSGEKTAWDLQGEGQAELIKAYSNAAVDKDKLSEALKQTYFEDATTERPDFTKKNVRIILSVAKNRDYTKKFDLYTPADRIDYLNLKLKITPGAGGFPKFIKWNRFETKFDTIKIADVSFERTLDTKLGLKAGNEASKNSAGLDIGATNKRTVAEAIRYRYVSLNGVLKPDLLQLEEEGNREIDLNDNITLDVTIEFEKTPDNFVAFKNLFDAKGKANKPDDAGINIIYFNMPDFTDNTSLTADIDFDYIFRHVLDEGLKTFPEYDDHVALINGKGHTSGVVLLSADEIKPKRWKIAATGGGATDIIKIFNANMGPLDIQFSDYYAAADFIRWLKTYPAAHDTDVLEVGGFNLSFASAAGVGLTKGDFKRETLEVKIVPVN